MAVCPSLPLLSSTALRVPGRFTTRSSAAIATRSSVAFAAPRSSASMTSASDKFILD